MRATAFICGPQVPCTHIASLLQAEASLVSGSAKVLRADASRCESCGIERRTSFVLAPGGNSISIATDDDSIGGDHHVRASGPFSPASRFLAIVSNTSAPLTSIVSVLSA